MTNLLNPDPAPTHEQLAQDAHARGDLAAALHAQEAHLTARRQAGTADAETFLFHALLQFQDGRLPDSLATIDQGLQFFPDAPTLHENRGVLLLTTGDNGGAMQACLRALECGSQSPNTHDCLADAAGRLGRIDLAVQYGRAALEAKDRMFSAYPALATMPTTPPPPFNPLNPAENIIAYTLWGDSDRYFIPLMENLRLIKHLYPGWTARIHLDASVPAAQRQDLAQNGAQIVEFQLPPDMPGHRRLLWRFAVLGDPTVRRYLIRDADSLLTVKERVAVDAWLASNFHFHTMRDYFTHTDLLLAGMWGGVGRHPARHRHPVRQPPGLARRGQPHRPGPAFRNRLARHPPPLSDPRQRLHRLPRQRPLPALRRPPTGLPYRRELLPPLRAERLTMDILVLLADLRRELAAGNISPATEAHLRNEFRAARVRANTDTGAAVFDREAAQLEREAASLRALRIRHFGE